MNRIFISVTKYKLSDITKQTYLRMNRIFISVTKYKLSDI